MERDRVLVAGIGGGSLGLEIVKCLRHADRYAIYGADSSDLATGHFLGLERTFVVPRDRFVDGLLSHCQRHGIRAVIPGGEAVLGLLCGETAKFQDAHVHLIGNDPGVVSICGDKGKLFRTLAELKIPAPSCSIIGPEYEARELPRFYAPPWVVKPATNTGGSRHVSLVSDEREAQRLVRTFLARKQSVLVQDYIPLEDGGEFTIGVLSLPDGRLDDDQIDEPVGVVVMRRVFASKLSVQSEDAPGLISSGISQGYIDEFPDIASQALHIAQMLGSRGPLNIQGRLRADNTLLPFEINPRFSSSTYLRCLAGYNEVDVYLQAVLHQTIPPPQPPVRPGFYLRGLTEVVVPASRLLSRTTPQPVVMGAWWAR